VLTFAGGRSLIAVEFKQRASAATAWQLVRKAAAHPNTPVMLVAEDTTAQAREILQEHGVALVDGLGNAHIQLPGLLIHLEGRRSHRQSRPARLSGKAGVIAQALLLSPAQAWQIQDLSKKTGASLGLVHRVVARLEAEGILSAEGTGPNRTRRMTNPTMLLDLWAEENVDRPTRTLGYILAQSPKQMLGQLAITLGRSSVDYALTGAAAASMVAPFVTSVPVVEVWVSATASADEVRAAAQADPVAEGQNVVFLQARDDTPLSFRDKLKDFWVVNPFRLYVDLRRDPRRGREQADHLRQEVIGF